jgi:hypothetical protein
LNLSLFERNTALETELRESIPSHSHFVLAPYVGYHSYDGSLGIENGAQIGMHFIGSFSRDWAFESGFGIVPTLENHRARSVFSVEFNLKRSFATVVMGDVYGLVGGSVDMATQAYLSPQIGVGIKWTMSRDFATRMDMIKGRDFVCSLGFEKRIVFDDRSRIVLPPAPAPAPAPVIVVMAAVPTPTPVPVPVPPVRRSNIETTVTVDPIRYQYVFESPVFSDTKGHWAEADLIRVTKLGLLEAFQTGNSELIVSPNRPLSVVEAAKMITVAAYLPKLIAALNSSVNYTLVDVPGVPYFVDLIVEDLAGNPVRILKSHERHIAGEYQVSWDGRGDRNKVLPIGDYRIKLTAFSKTGEVAGQSVTPIKILSKSVLEFTSKVAAAHFSDLPKDDVNQRYVNEWIAFGNSPVVLRLRNQKRDAKTTLFQPNQPISRLSFILGVSNAIKFQGAQNFVIADLSPYKDIQALPLDLKSRLGLYISELDYGGDDQKRLRPFQDITRAEAATIINRFLNWEVRRNKAVIPE